MTQETVEQFRLRARSWLSINLPHDSGNGGRTNHDNPADYFNRMRELQRILWDGGFAGIAWPAQYGGLGLSPQHQNVFNEECANYEMPISLNVPTFGILAATLLEFGTEDQKMRHIPRILRGEELWVQFLSEPTGGSDLAGCLTRADRDGDIFIMNGSKIWSSSAMVSDYAMCLARTNWDVPKHRGLTMFIVKIHQPGIQIEPIRMTHGATEFCQEFFDDVVIPASDVVGEIDDGWNVASRLLLHERYAVGGASIYTSGPAMTREAVGLEPPLIRLLRDLDLIDDPISRQLAIGHHVENIAHQSLVRRVSQAMAAGAMPPPAGSLLKLSHALLEIDKARVALEIGGSEMVVGSGSDSIARQLGDGSLTRQAISLGGGSNEIQRNIISERLMGMPREWSGDADIAYRDVRRNNMPVGPNQTS